MKRYYWCGMQIVGGVPHGFDSYNAVHVVPFRQDNGFVYLHAVGRLTAKRKGLKGFFIGTKSIVDRDGVTASPYGAR